MSQAVALAEMLKLVENHERARCREVTAQAQHEARRLLREAHAGARRRMHRHVQELKHFRDREQTRAQAEVATARRQHRQRCDRALLEAGRVQLRASLLARWQETGARRRWVENLVRQAFARLPRGRWTIAHPAGWDKAERDALTQPPARAPGAAPEWIEDRQIAAGLRFHVGGACLDGTLDGLLADRTAVEALLLAEIDRQD